MYVEATITIFEGNIEGDLMAHRRLYRDDKLTTNESMVATFSHEGDHNTNQQAINAIKDRHQGRRNNFDVEAPAYEITRQVIKEVQAARPPSRK